MTPLCGNTGSTGFLDMSLNVYAASHPLRSERTHYEVMEGATVEDIVNSIDQDSCIRSQLVVYVGDRAVPREYWKYVKPKANTSIAIRAVPLGGDGDKDGLRAVLTVIVVAVVSWFTLGAGASGTALATSSGGTTALGYVAYAAGTILGRLLVDAIAPPPEPEEAGSVDSDAKQPSIENARNRPQKFQPLPRIYGTYRFVPPYSVLPYTEVKEQ